MIKFIDRAEQAIFEPKAPALIAGAWVDTSNRWTVQAFAVPSVVGTPWQGMLRVGINQYRVAGDPRSGCEIVTNWSTIQEIKEALFPGRLAIEVYPSDHEVVNVAPMRWLWVLPAGCRLPFSLKGGLESVG